MNLLIVFIKIQDWFLLLCKFVILDKMTFSLGGGEEQAAAATVSALLCVQLGGGAEGAESFKMLCPILSSILIDSCASLSARQSVSLCLNRRLLTLICLIPSTLNMRLFTCISPFVSALELWECAATCLPQMMQRYDQIL